MPDTLHATYGGYSYELIIGDNEACVIQYSPTDNNYESRWFNNIKDAMAWWRELTDPEH